MPEGVPAEQNPSENVSGECRDLRDKCEDGRKIHLPGARHPASGIRGSDMSRVYEDMGGIMPVEAAEKWVARLMSPDWAKAEREEFEAWLRKTPENALAYEETKALWAGLGGLDEDEVLGPYTDTALEHDAMPFMAQWADAAREIRRPVQVVPNRYWLPSAGALAALLAMGILLWPQTDPQVPAVPYAATAKIENLQLQDGSKVQLDLGASLTVRLSPDKRDIELRQGRVMFRVAHDASRPFIVDAGAGRITALGTQFQVQREGEAVSVMLLEGSVGIDSAREGDERRLLRLVPGQRASYAPTTRSWTVATVDPVALTSWSQGFHVFGATPLNKAIAEINRYSAVKLKLANPALGKLPLSGSFKLGDGKAVAQALPYVLPVRVRSEEHTSELQSLMRIWY